MGLKLRWLGPTPRARSIRASTKSLLIIPRLLRSSEIVPIASGGCDEVRSGLPEKIVQLFLVG